MIIENLQHQIMPLIAVVSVKPRQNVPKWKLKNLNWKRENFGKNPAEVEEMVVAQR